MGSSDCFTAAAGDGDRGGGDEGLDWIGVVIVISDGVTGDLIGYEKTRISG